MHIHHGLDRVLNSIKNYYSSNHRKVIVKLNIIGQIGESSYLRKIINASNFDEIIVEHGFLNHQQINEIANNSHMAIGSLGLHRILINSASTLKVREYFARGIPYIISAKDP